MISEIIVKKKYLNYADKADIQTRRERLEIDDVVSPLEGSLR